MTFFFPVKSDKRTSPPPAAGSEKSGAFLPSSSFAIESSSLIDSSGWDIITNDGYRRYFFSKTKENFWRISGRSKRGSKRFGLFAAKRLTKGKSPADFMPSGDFLFTKLPAKINDAPLVKGIEIDQTRFRILQETADFVDSFDDFIEAVDRK